MATEKVRFTQEKETLLGTLYGRALDAKAANPLLGDTMAAEAVQRIDYDFVRLKVTPAVGMTVALRAKHLDDWTLEFLARHDTATVVHLGCGLDTRVYRIDPGPGVQWFDVDYPEVVELRRKLFPARDGYTQLGSSVTAPEWLEQIPADPPVLIVAEGLTMYLRPEQGRALLQRITDRFAHGTVAFDAFSNLGIRLQKLNSVVRKSGSTLYWGIDDPAELERWNPRLTCVDALTGLDGIDEVTSDAQRVAGKIMLAVPPLRTMARYLRYEF